MPECNLRRHVAVVDDVATQACLLELEVKLPWSANSQFRVCSGPCTDLAETLGTATSTFRALVMFTLATTITPALASQHSKYMLPLRVMQCS